MAVFKWGLFLLVMCVLAVCLSVLAVERWVEKPLALNGETLFEVKRGATLTSVARELTDNGQLELPQVALLYSKIKGLTAIQYGEYQLSADESWLSLNHKLIAGKTLLRQVTLVEGFTLKQALADLWANEYLVKTLDGVSDPRLLAILPDDHPDPEGWFFADTYSFQKGDSDLQVLTRAHHKLMTELRQAWVARASDLPLDTPYEALILASIVEKETGVGHERPLIAGVFTSRLKKNMRLQTDPTVIYGLGDSYQGNITRAHLKQATNFNTYVIKGLPPTPIALVGAASLRAATQPQATSALYFVAKGDGSHVFSDTLAEHNQAVTEYQIKNRAQQYRSAPNP